MDETIDAFSKLGMKVMITELDMDVLPSATRSQAAEVSMNFALQAKLNPYTNGLPDAVQQQLAKRYADLFAVFVKHHDVRQPRDILGRDRRRFLAQQLAGQGSHRLSAALQPRRQTQTRI